MSQDSILSGRVQKAPENFLSRTGIKEVFAEGKNGRRDFIRSAFAAAAAGVAAPVAMALGPRQLSHMARHWEQQNEEWEKEWLQGDADARMERRLEKAISRYNSFYGELNATQIALIKTQLAQSPWTAEWGRRDRQRRQQDLLSSLQRITQNNMTQAQAEAQLWGVWQRWLQPPDAGQRAVVQTLSQRACENLAQLHNTTLSLIHI